MPTAYHNQQDRIDTEKAIAFVEHIKAHLKPQYGQFPTCTICGKTIDEIYDEMEEDQDE